MDKTFTIITSITLLILWYNVLFSAPPVLSIIPGVFVLIGAIIHYYSKQPAKPTKSIIHDRTFLNQLSRILVWTAFFTTTFIMYPDVFSYTIYDNITITKITIAFTIFIATYVISRTITNHIVQQKSSDKTIIIKMRILHYTVILATFFIILVYLGISTEFKNIFLAGSITSIVIGLAAQKTLGNFIAGLILLTDKPFQVGDYIEVGNTRGYVLDVQFMSTVIKTFDEKIVRVPNEILITDKVTNYKKNKITKIKQEVPVSYSTDIQKARKVITRILDSEEYVLLDPQPNIVLDEYGDSAIILTVWYYTPFDEWYTTSKRVLERIKEEFDKNGIEIPFPQIDVHMK